MGTLHHPYTKPMVDKTLYISLGCSLQEMVGFEVFKHEEYKTVTGGFDIALIQLPRSAKSKVSIPEVVVFLNHPQPIRSQHL